ncbi:MAG: hypothetical protein ABSF26_30775 [Thermoguttaceae bacterium]
MIAILAAATAVVVRPPIVGGAQTDPSWAKLDASLVATQLFIGSGTGSPPSSGRGTATDSAARVVLISPECSTRVLSEGFYSACDPEVSFDATRVLFAGKKRATDAWNVYEATLDGRSVRQITKDCGDCRSPCYLGTFYTLDSPSPWRQIAMVSSGAGVWNACGSAPLTNLYSCKLDGSSLRQLTYNLSNDVDPCLLEDGRLLLASWQRSTPERGRAGYVGVFAVNTDGTDYSLFAEEGGKGVQHMPCATAKGLVVFVETDQSPGDGAGGLAAVSIRRPLHTYRSITTPADGLFHSPSPLPDGRILVSRRDADGRGTHGVWRLDPSSGRREPLFHDPRCHTIQAKLVRTRAEPDGRSSNVLEDDPHGKLYCLDICTSDLKAPGLPRQAVKRLRILEGTAWKTDGESGPPVPGTLSGCFVGPGPTEIAPAPRRVLGEVDIEEDGSFNVQIPADVPLQLQIVDARGMALRTCAWIWAKNHESRGCIGCHEDGELTPEDRFTKALGNGSSVLCPPPAERRSVDFRHDVRPIVEAKCVPCHRAADVPPRLADGLAPGPDDRSARRVYQQLTAADPAGKSGAYVHPGRARTSPLAWHLFGQNTARPWDGAAAAARPKPIPPSAVGPLTDEEKRMLILWIDTGAAWDSRNMNQRGGL